MRKAIPLLLAVVVIAVSVLILRHRQDPLAPDVGGGQLLEPVDRTLPQPDVDAQMPATPEPVAEVGTVAADEGSSRSPAPRADPAVDLAGALVKNLKSPDRRDALIASARKNLARQYPELAEVVGLSPDQTDALLDLLASQRTQAGLDALPPGPEEAPVQLTPDEITAIVEARDQRNEDEVRDLLAEKYVPWKSYQKSMPARREVRDLKAALGSAGESINAGQEAALVDALTAERDSFEQDSRVAPAPSGQGRTDPRARLHERLINAASGYLDAVQLEAYRKLLERR
jgi:hypothetical protein